jgi:alpha-beta hydrolase superfamily lysophospholipase
MYWLYFCVVLIAICFTGLYFFQEKFIFLNGEKLDKDYSFEFSDNFEEIFLETKDGNVINAIHFKLNNPKGVLLFCHGNNGNLKKWGSKVSFFLNYSYEVVVFDYRNYGKSTGNFNEVKMYDDALLVYDYLKNTFKETAIVVYGFSIGTTFATRIATLNKPKELILEAPFFNFKTAVQYYSKCMPTFLLKYTFRTDLDILKVTAPITIFHGNKDRTTYFKDAQELFALNKSLNNKFIEIKEGTHHNIRDSKFYKKKLQQILNR